MTDIYNLKNGATYKVTKEFTDFDGKIHEVGETWAFEKITYLPYHSGVSLFVIEDGKEVIYRFQDEAEGQQGFLTDLTNYIELV